LGASENALFDMFQTLHNAECSIASTPSRMHVNRQRESVYEISPATPKSQFPRRTFQGIDA
jgi:hypothetical protein